MQNVWKETLGKPVWWVLSNVLWVAISLIGGRILHTQNWLNWIGWVVAGVAVITLIFGMAAAQRIVNRQESAHQTQIAHLESKVQREWEEKLKTLQGEQEERDMPEMIASINNLSNLHRKSLGIHNAGYKAPLDWVLSQLPKSSERIARKAYAQWTNP